MRLGLSLWPDRDPRALADLAVAAEDAGFDDLWLPDHYNLRDCGVVLTLCATRTRRIRLGTAVVAVLLRHPAILASFFATLDEISDGRALAGLGPGGFEVKSELAVGTPSPLSATREAVRIVRDLCAGERVALPEVRAFPVTNAGLAFRRPAIPVWLAGRGVRMLELAGEVADGVITHGMARGYLDLVNEQVTAGAARGGRQRADCQVALMFDMHLDEDLQRARDTLRPGCLVMAGGEYAEALIPRYGLDPAKVAPLRAALRAGDPGAVRLLDDDMVDAFAVGGPRGFVVERLQAIREAGVDALIVGPGKSADAATIARLGQVLHEAYG
ncbi:MAG TPA: LLM class flavin-dependent oxidoreductase [Chloroflexota bacterium]